MSYEQKKNFFFFCVTQVFQFLPIYLYVVVHEMYLRQLLKVKVF